MLFEHSHCLHYCISCACKICMLQYLKQGHFLRYVLIIGYISRTFLVAISSGNLAYTTLASWVSASDSTRIFPILIDRQQSLRPLKEIKLLKFWLHQNKYIFYILKLSMLIIYLLHGFSAAHNTDTTIPFFVLETFIVAPCRGGDGNFGKW
jgi:hypothetical protein